MAGKTKLLAADIGEAIVPSELAVCPLSPHEMSDTNTAAKPIFCRGLISYCALETSQSCIHEM